MLGKPSTTSGAARGVGSARLTPGVKTKRKSSSTCIGWRWRGEYYVKCSPGPAGRPHLPLSTGNGQTEIDTTPRAPKPTPGRRPRTDPGDIHAVPRRPPYYVDSDAAYWVVPWTVVVASAYVGSRVRLQMHGAGGTAGWLTRPPRHGLRHGATRGAGVSPHAVRALGSGRHTNDRHRGGQRLGVAAAPSPSPVARGGHVPVPPPRDACRDDRGTSEVGDGDGRQMCSSRPGASQFPEAGRAWLVSGVTWRSGTHRAELFWSPVFLTFRRVQLPGARGQSGGVGLGHRG